MYSIVGNQLTALKLQYLALIERGCCTSHQGTFNESYLWFKRLWEAEETGFYISRYTCRLQEQRSIDRDIGAI